MVRQNKNKDTHMDCDSGDEERNRRWRLRLDRNDDSDMDYDSGEEARERRLTELLLENQQRKNYTNLEAKRDKKTNKQRISRKRSQEKGKEDEIEFKRLEGTRSKDAEHKRVIRKTSRERAQENEAEAMRLQMLQSKNAEQKRLKRKKIHEVLNAEDFLPECNYLGNLEKTCPYCGALFFPKANFNCCDHGKVYLDPPRPAPEPLISLLSDDTPQARFFRNRCKATNSAFAFASIQYNKLAVGPHGVQSEKVRGDIYHIPSALYPKNEKQPAFGNFYVYDAKEAAKQRTHGSLASQLDPKVVAKLSTMFEENNQLARSFKHMHEICKQYKGDDRKKLKLPRMRLVNRYELSEEEKQSLEGHPGQYHHPEDEDMISCLYESTAEGSSLPRGLTVYPRLRPRVAPKPITYFSAIIDPACYPLIYPYGEMGWAHKKYAISSKEEAEQRKLRNQNPFGRIEIDRDILTNDEDVENWEPLPEDHNLEVSDVEEEEDSGITETTVLERNMCEEIKFIDSQGELRPVQVHIENKQENKENNLIFNNIDSGSEEDTDENEDDLSELVESDTLEVQTKEEIAEIDAYVLNHEDSDDSGREVPRMRPPGFGNRISIHHKPILHHMKQEYVSMRQFYNYRYQKRNERYHKYTSTRKLGQLHMIDVFTRLTNQRFEAIRRFYTHDMKTKKNRLFEKMAKAAQKKGRTLGILVTVPKTVVGSPRYYRAKYQDAISIVNKIGKPDLFITFTANREWREIKENLSKGSVWVDEPMLIVQVFNEKKKLFLERVVGKKGRDGAYYGGIFGTVVAYVYSVEFQQRGMPHLHILITLREKLDNVRKIDKMIWGFLPTVPNESSPNHEKMQKLRSLVEKLMVHSPCKDKPMAYCQIGKDPKMTHCNKGFPKQYQDHTTLGKDGYACLKRPRNDERCSRNDADNAYVVPYSPQILAEFESHCNVKVVTSISTIRYIFKYVLKGQDRVLLELIEKVSIDDGTETGNIGNMDVSGHILHPQGIRIPPGAVEIEERNVKEQLMDAGIRMLDDNGKPIVVHDETIHIKELRATTCVEAAYHIAAYELTGSSHTVVSLPIHLPNEETIFFNAGEEAETARKVEERDPVTKLKAYFQLCSENEEARQYTYSEVPLFYTYESGCWRKRKRDWSRRIVGRVPAVQPRYLNTFALRLMLMNTKGAKCFEDLLTVQGQRKETFVEAAQEAGFLNGEQVWQKTMQEGASELMPQQLRHLFATILVFGAPSDPLSLWEQFKGDMLDRKNWIQQMKEARALQNISNILERNGCTLLQFHLPLIDEHFIGDPSSVDEDGWIQDPKYACKKRGEEMRKTLTVEQEAIVQRILSALDTEVKQKCYFMNGQGGSGKTHVYKVLHNILTGKGVKVLNVAHTGIAATNLPGGSTVHRAFGIPMELDEDVNSNMDFESMQANTLRNVEVVVWDEATMSDRRILECVNRLLCALTNCDKPFGGKLMLLGGDWRQLLPIVDGISDEGVIDYTLKGSCLWKEFEILRLTHNIRATEDPEYCQLIEDIGDGKTISENGKVKLPYTVLIDNEEELIKWVYGDINLKNVEEVKDKCILTMDNKSCEELNEKVLKMLPGEEYVYDSIDCAEDEKSFVAIPTETYHLLTPTGLPPHKLHLKNDSIVILLRNIDVRLGLCNGTKMRIMNCKKDLIVCETLSSKKIFGIPRIRMTSNTTRKGELSFIRTQYPIRLAYSLTVNKSQGQTLEKMGLVLRTPPFAHGHLYVAMSRVKSLKGFKMTHYDNFVNDKKGHPIIEVNNIVYKDIL